jgi:hypothetical protein
MSQKTKTTNRKFYGKWLYKVSLSVKGSGIFRIRSLSDVLIFCNKTEDTKFPGYTMMNKAWNNRDQILELAEFLSSYDPKIWTKRIENTNIDFYTNDKDFYEAISEKFESTMTHRFEPDIANLDLLEQAQTIVVNKLPHKRYKFKVYLLPYKLAGDKESKFKYINWVKTQSPRITCTPAVENWFIKTDWNWDRRYVLVEDENTLLMLKLRNSEVVGRVYNYIISDK